MCGEHHGHHGCGVLWVLLGKYIRTCHSSICASTCCVVVLMCLASHLGCTSCLSKLVSSFESVLLGLVRCMGISRPEGVVYRSVRGSDLITMRSLWMQAASIPTVLWSFRRPPEETNSPLCTAASFQALRHLACNDTVLLPLTATGWALEKKLGSAKKAETGQDSDQLHVGACHCWSGRVDGNGGRHETTNLQQSTTCFP